MNDAAAPLRLARGRGRAGRLCRVVAAALLLAVFPIAAQEPTAQPEPSPQSVPLSDVPTRAATVQRFLRGVDETLSPQAAVVAIKNSLPEVLQSIGEQERATGESLASRPTIEALDRQDSVWRGFESLLARWSSTLRDRSVGLETKLADLGKIEVTWRETARAARSGAAPETILASIADVERGVVATKQRVVDRRADVLTVQQRVAAAANRVAEQRESIAAARSAFVGSLMVRDSPALWNWFETRDSSPGSLFARALAAARIQAKSMWFYLQAEAGTVWLHVAVILLIGVQLAHAGRRAGKWGEDDAEASWVARIFAVPYSAALLLGVLVMPWLYPRSPSLLRDAAGAMALVPAIRILRNFLPERLHLMLHALGGFYFLDRLRSLLAVSAPLERTLFLAELIGAIVLIARMPRPRAGASRVFVWNEAQRRGVRLAQRLLIACFAVGALAMCLGYARLGKLLGDGALSCVYVGMILYAAAQAGVGAWIYALRSPPLVSLSFVREYRWLLQRRGRRAITFVAGLAWILLALRFFGLLWPLGGFLDWLLHAEIPIGQLSLSPADFLLFFAVIWGSFLLSRFLRFVLAEDVYPRFALAQGVPYALSTLLHYVLVLLGFFVAVGAVGFDLSRVSLIAGALSVGIGFGLQTLVNNFVSGLILLFERPVKVGDAIEVQGVGGVVRRIGIRSSTIRTWDGAEVIVPNGSLIAESVTNWTLSDRSRRIEIDVGVEYGSDPQQVLAILSDVACKSEGVMKDPAPIAMFQGFGDSSLDFRLRFWTSEFDRWLLVRSEIAVAVNAALGEAGITIPFPQRDVHLRSLDFDIPAAPGGESAPPAGGQSSSEEVR